MYNPLLSNFSESEHIHRRDTNMNNIKVLMVAIKNKYRPIKRQPIHFLRIGMRPMSFKACTFNK